MSKITGGNALIDPQVIVDKLKVEERMKIADLGCGSSGHFVFPLARTVGKYGTVYAVDILKHNLVNVDKIAKQDGLQWIKTVWSNLEIFGATKIETSSLDNALLINILYQSDKRVEIVREAIRLLKKGGKLLITDWNKTATPFGPSPAERVSKTNLISVCQRLNMELVEEFDAGMYHFGTIFLKN